MNASEPVRVGAVIYAPQVTIIWEIMRDFFEERGLRMDVVFYANYETQVIEFAKGATDVVWNSPLAWLHSQRMMGGSCRAIVMRDTDRDRVSHFVARKDGPVKKLTDLRGKRVGFGAIDSPQATLIPGMHLSMQGLESGRDYEGKRFDVLVGLHGDHIGGELDAFRAMQAGAVDTSAMLDLNWQRWSRDGTIDPNVYTTIDTTPRFDHCVFTVRQDFPAALEKRFADVLFAMSYDDPKHKEMMDLEGLKQWVPGRVSGFGPLQEAVSRTGYFGAQR